MKDDVFVDTILEINCLPFWYIQFLKTASDLIPMFDSAVLIVLCSIWMGFILVLFVLEKLIYMVSGQEGLKYQVVKNDYLENL